MRQIIIFFFLLLISGCAQINENNNQELNKTSIENKTVIQSMIETTKNIQKLKEEINDLENQVNQINQQIKKLENNQTLIITKENKAYLNYLNELVESSQAFTTSLRGSIYYWDSYISSAETKNQKIQKINNTKIANSIINPVKSFE